MFSSIWTQCAGPTELQHLAARPWRVVEGQHVISTRKLVDSDAEQQLLEELIEGAKPPIPAEPEFQGLHYLLSTPFRYPPLRHGSRFGTRNERGIWYGADELSTALAETAYYRLVFLEATEGSLGPVAVDLSAFAVKVVSERGVDLSEAPFSDFEAAISSPAHYKKSQQLGLDMRQAGVEIFRYRSARDPERGTNLGIFTPKVFAERRPSEPDIWYCVTTTEVVELSRRTVFERESARFPRKVFEVEGRLPAPAV